MSPMASRTLTRPHTLLRITRYPLPYSFPTHTKTISQQSFHSLQSHEIPPNHESILSERFVLAELSNLLPIDLKPSDLFDSTLKSKQEIHPQNPTDRFLSPDEKLRGIFLQKFTSKFALESALSATGVQISPEIFSSVMNKGNMSGAAILSFFDWAVRHSDLPNSIENYNLVLNVLGKRKFLGFMVDVSLRLKMNSVKPNAETVEIILNSFVRSRQVSKAVEFFKSLEDIGAIRDTETLNIFIKCLCCRSHVGVASSLLSSMKGEIPFNELTYNEIIAGWAKFGKVDRVVKYWKGMVEENFNPNCQTFCYLIEALGRSGRISDALEIFNKMEKKGCIPDASVYNAMISNCISVGDIEEAISYYKTMCEKNCSPDIDTYNKLIKGFLKVRRVADALELFDEMLKQGVMPTASMITSFIERLCKFGPPHAAMMIYKTAMNAKCRVSLKVYKILFMRLSRCGKGGMMLKLWEEMQESGYALDDEVYDHIVNGLCNIGQVETAVLVVNEALRNGFCPGRIVYSKLNNKLMAMGKVETAYKLFLKVKDARNSENLQSYWRSKGWHF